MKPIYDGLQKAVKSLEVSNFISYGTVKVPIGEKEKKVQVIDVVAQLIVNGEVQLERVKELTKDGIEGLSVMDLNQISNNVSMTT